MAGLRNLPRWTVTLFPGLFFRVAIEKPQASGIVPSARAASLEKQPLIGTCSEPIAFVIASI